ncbi:uncharacterized protein LOC125009230 [Mugil cephalus]|uniref:uncharacterized protein LOC125009230 n=1 Tax=Mugil cephalus TaxID=48193 RepID=UPI001FB85FDD|nr:uncharacterized protein LOC125009230 [Mugil cephalus]
MYCHHGDDFLDQCHRGDDFLDQCHRGDDFLDQCHRGDDFLDQCHRQKHPKCFHVCSVCGADIYDRLWTNNLDIAKRTLEVPFLQDMQLGDLQADYYVSFTIQDVAYLVKVTEMLKQMCQKVKEPEDIHQFMLERFNSYNKYAEETLKLFNLKSVSDINLTSAMKKYLSDYTSIMNDKDPIYFVVALLPFARLWLWLANHLKETPCNAYFTWKKQNSQGHPEKHYKALLNKYLTTADQITQANSIFRQQMQNEHEFFASSLKKQNSSCKCKP